MHQHLHPVRALVDEQIRMVSLGLTEDTDNATQRGINPCAHVYRFHCEPGCIDSDHFKTSRSHIAHSCTAERGHCTDRVIVPRRSSTVIGVASSALGGIGNAMKLPFGDGLGGGGRALCGAIVPSARSASTTQRLTTFAFIERSSAAAAVDAPGLRQAATASALNCALYDRRRRRPASWSIVHRVRLLYRGHYALTFEVRLEGEFAGRLQVSRAGSRISAACKAWL